MVDEVADTGSRPAPMRSWERLRRGNDRFVAGRPEHPGQDAAKRAELRGGQRPYAVVLGCSDSRVAAEIVFDQGLGDLFVVRTAGHVVDTGVLGSLEFGVAALGIPLVVVLGHDGCGAVRATVEALEAGRLPSGFVRDVVERVTPSVLAARRQHDPAVPTLEQIEAEHVRQTAALLTERSTVIGAAVRTSRCAVVPATYRLADGRVHAVLTSGPEVVREAAARAGTRPAG
jgi:carbonic anhydrase